MKSRRGNAAASQKIGRALLLSGAARDQTEAHFEHLEKCAPRRWRMALGDSLGFGAWFLEFFLPSAPSPEKTLQHYRTIQALPLILGPDKKADAEYLDTCRIKRNTVEYDRAGAATRSDAEELIEFTRELRKTVVAWLEQNHIELLLPSDQA